MKDDRTHLSNYFHSDWCWRMASVWLYGPRQNLISRWEFYQHLQGLNRPCHSDTQSWSPSAFAKVSQSFELLAFEC